MTPGQQRAMRELERLRAAAPDVFEVIGDPKDDNGRVIVTISLRIGPLEKREGGLVLRERESFKMFIPPDFPFDYPSLKVEHNRFSGFPHVIWSRTLCLYQSKIEWNPADGLFGYFDRLSIWLARAARNDMDPVDGPLEPPHYVTDFSQVPIVIRSNAPVTSGDLWIGWAEVQKLSNRIEIVGWRAFMDELPAEQRVALAIMLPQPLPMEFPQQGGELFRELLKGGIGRDFLLRLLGMAALVTPENEPAHLVVGLPMRRAADGTPRLHIAVWTTDSEYAGSLRRSMPEPEDSEALRDIQKELADAIYSLFEVRTIKWCHVLDDREEIVVPRDRRTPVAWFKGKRVLILGCGALGSWAAEVITRSKPAVISIVDKGMVKPGLLVRQNYILEDIGSSKATALANRLRAISTQTDVHPFHEEALEFICQDLDRLKQYDLVLDCTASSIFQMKLDRDWAGVRDHIRQYASLLIDARAQRLLGVILGHGSKDGPWSAFVRLKHKLCAEERRSDLIEAFYSERASAALFQPEPGCSDPTFSGSMADVTRLIATGLNLVIGNLAATTQARGIACSLPSENGETGTSDLLPLAPVREVPIGAYRLLISQKAINQARSFARQNARRRSARHETGGLLWGYWDDASGFIVILDASGPPPDSQHDPGHFNCGVEGTDAEHKIRSADSCGVSGFLGFWHTHPGLPPEQSLEDIHGMTRLVARLGHNQRRAVMLIFGRTAGESSAGAYVYEAQPGTREAELLHVGFARLFLATPVV